MKSQSQIESEKLDKKEVFSISHDDIAKTRVTQCKKHEWIKIDEENLTCKKCPTGVKIAPGTANKYV